MTPRNRPLLVLPLAVLAGCPLPPELVTCEEAGACETTQPASTGDGGPPTTGPDVQTVTGDDADGGDSTAGPDAESGADTTGTTGEPGDPAEPPLIVSRVVMPDYTKVNALLLVRVTAEHADGVRMLLDSGELSELTPLGAGEFEGHIKAFTGIDNKKHTVIFTPWRGALEGESASADYVIALPDPGDEVYWDPPLIEGVVAALAVLPDGRPVEFGTLTNMGEPRCYLRPRDKQGNPGPLVPVLEGAHCTAIDMTIDRETGMIHLLLERKSGDGLKWWAGEMSGWGSGLKNIGIGAAGDTALALASRPGLVAICGARPLPSEDKRDALVVLLRDGQAPDTRALDYNPSGLPNGKHRYGETARDCVFSGDTLAIVGEAWGQHAGNPKFRDRLMLLELDTASDTEPGWTVPAPKSGVQARALAVDVDDQGQYHLAGYQCLDVCTPEGEVRVHAPGGKLVSHTALGPLGSAWFGPNAIAWSPAGYAVVALGEMHGQTPVFKVQAYAPNVPEPLWTYVGNGKDGLQFVLDVAVGAFGEVYVGGVASGNKSAFAIIGG